MNFKKNISIIGLGKLGLCMAACFAEKGYKVIGVDIDTEKIALLNRGISPVEETALAALIKKVRSNLRATQDYEEAMVHSDATFIVVSTPSQADGSFSNEYLERVLRKIAEGLKRKTRYHLIIVTSTVMPQTIEKVVKFLLEKISGKKCGRDFGLAYNPAFIALGSVIHDFLNPDFILIGETNKKDGDILEEIYKNTCENKPRFARMSPLNAEITKLSLNCYITTKITFANSVAAICDRIKGADANVILQTIGMDSRVGSRYIRPGLGYGGPCFPRDNVAFATFARKMETKAKLAEMIDVVNRDQVSRVVTVIKENLNKNTKTIRIGILGLSYKPDTPIIEDSQAIEIVQLLVKEGYQVKVYDPQGLENARSVLGNTVKYAKGVEDCLKGVEIGVIAVPWQEFKKIALKKINKNIIFLDCWGILKDTKDLNVKILGVGS